MTSGKVWWLGAGGLVVAAGLLFLSWPYASSTFHLEMGGRALEWALPNTDALDWWYVGPRDPKNQQALQVAIWHLERAGKSSYAHRLLGRAYWSQGNLSRSVEALERFTTERPDHRLGRMELAAAYALMDRRLAELEYVDLVARLPGATVTAPDIEGQAQYRPEGWASEYVYPTTFGLPPNYGDRPTLFIHAGSQVTYTVALTAPGVLRFGMGIDPRSLEWGGDGATFEVFVDGKRVFLEHLPVERAREGWQEREVDLAGHVGQTIHLALATTPGPTGDVAADWAGWGEPRVEAPEAEAYRDQVRGRPWLAAWSRLDLTAQDWIRTGTAALKTRQYARAQAWYGWAAITKPEQASRYQDLALGLMYADQGLWAEALPLLEKVLETREESDELPLGTIHYQIGKIQKEQLGQWSAAQSSFEAALASGGFLSDLDLADTHYHLGVILWYAEEQRAAVEELELAVEVVPHLYGALIQLGNAYWALDGNFRLAETTLYKAVGASRGGKWAYKALGDLYYQAGMAADALAQYREVLRIDPADQDAQIKVKELERP